MTTLEKFAEKLEKKANKLYNPASEQDTNQSEVILGIVSKEVGDYSEPQIPSKNEHNKINKFIDEEIGNFDVSSIAKQFNEDKITQLVAQEAGQFEDISIPAAEQFDQPKIEEYAKQEAGEYSIPNLDQSQNNENKPKSRNKGKLDHFEFEIYKKLKVNHIFKCVKEQMFYYYKPDGIFKHLNEHKMKILVRTGWSENTLALLSRYAVLEIIDRLKTDPEIQASEKYFDHQEHLINFQNGVLNLETNELLAHSPEYGFTSCIRANYDPAPTLGHTFKKFIETCIQGDKDKEVHLQEAFGYLISNFYRAKVAPFIIGKPHSGKSKLVEIISELIGKEHVATVPLHRLHERFMLANLFNKKVNICSEINDTELTNLEVFKAITGNDEITAEFKGKDHFTYKSKVKLMFAGNEMPKLKKLDKTSAFFDRLTFINFNYSVPKNLQDPYLVEKILDEEKPYIVHWAVNGVKQLMRNNFSFSECEESIKFKENYIKNQNNVIDFVDDLCELGKEYRIHSQKLYQAYIKYCFSNCLIALEKDKFFDQIVKFGATKSKFRLNKSNPLAGYIGIRVKPDQIEI